MVHVDSVCCWAVSRFIVCRFCHIDVLLWVICLVISVCGWLLGEVWDGESQLGVVTVEGENMGCELPSVWGRGEPLLTVG